MSRYARSLRFGAPAAEVWAALVDVESWPAWASQFKQLERLDGVRQRQAAACASGRTVCRRLSGTSPNTRRGVL